METNWKKAFKQTLKPQENETKFDCIGQLRRDWDCERMYTQGDVRLGKEYELGLFFDFDYSIRKHSQIDATVSGTMALVYEEYLQSIQGSFFLRDGKAQASRLSSSRVAKSIRKELRRRISRYFSSMLDGASR